MGVLPVSKKEGKEKRKNGIGHRMKNGRANLKQNKAFTNGGLSVYDVIALQFCREAK